MKATYLVPEGGKSMSDLCDTLKEQGYDVRLFDNDFEMLDEPCSDGSYYKWNYLSLLDTYTVAEAGDSIEINGLEFIVHRGTL